MTRSTIITKFKQPMTEVYKEINKNTGKAEIIWKKGGYIVKREDLEEFRLVTKREFKSIRPRP